MPPLLRAFTAAASRCVNNPHATLLKVVLTVCVSCRNAALVCPAAPACIIGSWACPLTKLHVVAPPVHPRSDRFSQARAGAGLRAQGAGPMFRRLVETQASAALRRTPVAGLPPGGKHGNLLPSPEQIGAACRTLVASGVARRLRCGRAWPQEPAGRRPFFTRFAQQQQLHSLEKSASASPGDAFKQTEYLKKLNTHDPGAGAPLFPPTQAWCCGLMASASFSVLAASTEVDIARGCKYNCSAAASGVATVCCEPRRAGRVHQGPGAARQVRSQ